MRPISEPEKKYKVQIIRRREITTYPRVGLAKKTMMVTYQAEGLPPRTISIPVEEYNPDTEKKLIREDIEKQLQFKPEELEV